MLVSSSSVTLACDDTLGLQEYPWLLRPANAASQRSGTVLDTGYLVGQCVVLWFYDPAAPA